MGIRERIKARLLFLFNPSVSFGMKWLASIEGARLKVRKFRCKSGIFHYWIRYCIDFERPGFIFRKCVFCKVEEAEEGEIKKYKEFEERQKLKEKKQ